MNQFQFPHELERICYSEQAQKYLAAEYKTLSHRIKELEQFLTAESLEELKENE